MVNLDVNEVVQNKVNLVFVIVDAFVDAMENV